MFQKGILNNKPFFIKVLVLISIMVFNGIIGTYIAAFGVQFFTGYSIEQITYAISQGVDLTPYANALRVLQLIQVVFIFILSGFVFLHLNDAYQAKVFTKHWDRKLLSIAILFFIVTLPIIDAISVWNDSWHLPEAFNSLEQSFRTSENQAKKMTEAFLITPSLIGLLSNLLIVSLLAALSEELIFRGIIQNMLMESNKNIFLSILCTSIIFSAIHFQFYGFIPRMMMGMFLGYLYHWSQNLWYPIIAHAFNNGMAVLLSWMYANAYIQFNPDESLDFSMVVLITTGILSILLLYFAYKSRKIPYFGNTNG